MAYYNLFQKNSFLNESSKIMRIKCCFSFIFLKNYMNEIQYVLLPLLWVRSKLTPWGGMQRFDWNGYSAALGWWYFSCTGLATSPLCGTAWLLWPLFPVYCLHSSPSSPVHESHKSFWLPDCKVINDWKFYNLKKENSLEKMISIVLWT